MNSLVRQYFSEGNNFDKIIFLNDCSSMSWNELSKITPACPRGWFELSRISVENRIHFTYDFWVDQLPFNAHAGPILSCFFEKLDDVDVVLNLKNDSWSAELVYSLNDNSSFFRGLPGATQSNLDEIKTNFSLSLPKDYLSFMKIHNGFGQLSEMGLLKIEELSTAKRRLTEMILKTDQLVKSDSVTVDPSALFPFYEVYGLSSFQCFYADWYPTNQMGNVYFSGIDYTVSDVKLEGALSENLAFPTFLEWFVYYLEGMNLSP